MFLVYILEELTRLQWEQQEVVGLKSSTGFVELAEMRAVGGDSGVQCVIFASNVVLVRRNKTYILKSLSAQQNGQGSTM